MSISGASGDHSQATSSADGLLACRTSSDAGNDCQKFLMLTASPPPRSPTYARPGARLPAAEKSQVLFGFVRLTMVKPSGFGWTSLKSSQIAFLREYGATVECLARLLRGAASTWLERLGPQSAVLTREAHRAVSGLLAHRHRDLQAKAAHEIFFLIAVKNDRMHHPHRSLTAVEIKPHRERQPFTSCSTIPCARLVHALNLHHRPHRAGLLDRNFLHEAKINFRASANPRDWFPARFAGCTRAGWRRHVLPPMLIELIIFDPLKGNGAF
jgi:hypothetical protein